jgi:hypothetical protein
LPRSDDAGAGLPLVYDSGDPLDCEEAKTSKSYVGCDYWPTVTPNAVWSIFDYAVVVANTGAKDASVTVTGPNGVNKQVTVPPSSLRKIYLPWVPELKGPDADVCGLAGGPPTSIVVPNGAYHLVSSLPVIVYQFNALQYQPVGGEGPNGSPKNWGSSPGASCNKGAVPFFSFSNDSSLLLPSTAMTGNYRVTGYPGSAVSTPALTVTATAPNTQVTLSLSGSATIVRSASGAPIEAATSGQARLTLASAGDVVQFIGDFGKDFSGSLVQSDKPVQVISGLPCINIPGEFAACDHIEETVLPAETLGTRYVVAPPTGTKGVAVGQVVRIYGNQDDTTLTYLPNRPAGCPERISAGQTADCGVVDVPFEVTGTKEFGVSTFLLGATVHNDVAGDPSQSNVAAVEQFRTAYVFLAPNDYPILFADVTAPKDAKVEIDGAPVTEPWTPIAGGAFGVQRVSLTRSSRDGAHTLSASAPVGLQVIGYGAYTSFQYPAGLNLKRIAPPPPPLK